MLTSCNHDKKLQRRTQRFVEGQWKDSTIEIGCASCDARLSFLTKEFAFYSENTPRRVLDIEPYTNHETTTD